MTDDLAFEALAKFPAGVAPDYCFMNRRPPGQIRRSGTKAMSSTGVPTLRTSARSNCLEKDPVRSCRVVYWPRPTHVNFILPMRQIPSPLPAEAAS